MSTRSSSEFEIVGVHAWEIDIPLTDRFTIARGSMAVAENVFVCAELRCGAVGYGECAPFAELTGEERDGTLQALNLLRKTVTGHSAMSIRQTSRLMA